MEIEITAKRHSKWIRGTAPHQPRAASVQDGRDSLAYIVVTFWGAFSFVRNILKGFI